MERIILTTGGTGGHVFPALAVAEEVRRRDSRAMILFMGGQYGQEADMAAKAGLDFVGLPVRGVLGRGGRGVLAVFGMLRGLIKAYGIIRKVQPELVVGFGGYACFAGVLAAMTTLPVLGVPMTTSDLGGLDSLLSMVQMPAGIPVGTTAIGKAGAKNAALLALAILALSDPRLSDALKAYRANMRAEVEAADAEVQASTV